MGSVPSQSIPALDVHLSALKRELEKKTSFLAGVRALESTISTCDLGDQGREQLGLLLPLVYRAFSILKSRHTNVQFWTAGRSLAITCLVGNGDMNVPIPHA